MFSSVWLSLRQWFLQKVNPLDDSPDRTFLALHPKERQEL